MVRKAVIHQTELKLQKFITLIFSEISGDVSIPKIQKHSVPYLPNRREAPIQHLILPSTWKDLGIDFVCACIGASHHEKAGRKRGKTAKGHKSGRALLNVGSKEG